MACQKTHDNCSTCKTKIKGFFDDDDDDACGCDLDWRITCEQCYEAFCDKQCAASSMINKLYYIGPRGTQVPFSTCESCFDKLRHGLDSPKGGWELFIALNDL